VTTRILNQMGYIYTFDAGASNGYNSMVGGYNPPNENQYGPQVGLEALLGDWLVDYDEQISDDGIFSWNEVPNAAGYRVFAFRYGQQFQVNIPSNITHVWAGGFNPTANAEGVDELTAHEIRSSIGLDSFHITNNTHVMSILAVAYADTTETSLDLTTMGLAPGKYEFRVQALAPEDQGPPLTTPPLINLPFKNALLSGVQFEDERSLNIVTGTYFPTFVIEGEVQEQVPSVTMEVATTTIGDTAFAPIRVIAEALGTDVNWNPATQEVTLVRADGETITFAISQYIPALYSPAQVIDGRTFVHVNFILDFFESSVNYDASTGLIEVLS